MFVMEQHAQHDVPFLGISVAFILLVHILHAYLDIRQLRAIQKPKPPAARAGEQHKRCK